MRSLYKNKLLIYSLCATSLATTSQASTFQNFGSYLKPSYTSQTVANAGQTTVNVIAGIAWDTISTDDQGNYNLIYLVNKSASNAKRDLYAYNLSTETTSPALHLQSATQTTSTRSISSKLKQFPNQQRCTYFH